ncbi:primase-helicase family protein [Terricaulis sp.]|uniref:primase-helicase family protein n=1 Tax=Terricaulis sp. TaxID=2768686 RepID=UPI0037847A74
MTILLPQTAADALRHIHKGAQSTQYLQARLVDPVARKGYAYSSRIDELGGDDGLDALAVAESGGWHIYINVGLSDARHEHCMVSGDVTGWDCFFIDFDLKSERKPHCPETTLEIVDFLTRDLPIQPTLIADSGSGGVHAYFCLASPFFLVLPTSRGRLDYTAKGFEKWVHGLAHEKRGWRGFDSVSEIGRSHRCFFTLNIKPGVNGLCRPIWASDDYYEFDQIEQLALEGMERFSARLEAIQAEAQPERNVFGDRLDALDELWWAEAKDRKGKKSKEDEETLLPNPAAIVEGCAFARHAYDYADVLPEPEWFAALTIFARTLGGDMVAHDASASHPGYTKQATDKKIEQVLKSEKGGPATCAHIELSLGFDGCVGCPFRGLIKSPISLGERTTDQVKLIKRTAYVSHTNEMIDLAYTKLDGLEPSSFGKANLHRRFLSSPEHALLADPLLPKAYGRTYRPDKPTGVMKDERGVSLLNYYEAPIFGFEVGSPQPFFDHIDYLVPNQRDRSVLINYLAHLVQKPHQKIRWSIGLVGAQRTGKNYLVDNLMRKLLGEDNVNVVIGSRLGDRFDGAMAGGVLLTVDEVEINGKAEVYERLKTIITQETRQFERKNKNLEELPTPRGVVFISNHTHAFFLPKGDGRFFVIDTVDHQHPGGASYYGPLFELKPEFVAGVRAALMTIDLSGFDSNTLPYDTDAKNRMVENSKSDLANIVQECVDERQGPFRREVVTLEEIRDFGVLPVSRTPS